MATALVLGANRGIGLAFARQLAARGDTVIGTARRPDAATTLSKIADRIERCDVRLAPTVDGLADNLAGTTIDLLICNAGILRGGGLEDSDPRDVLAQLEVNALGPFRIVQALLPNLRAAAKPKIVLMSSRVGSIADNSSGGAYGYRASKAALNAIGKSLALDLAPWPVLLMSPGYVQTDMTGGQGDVTPEEAVTRMLAIIDRAEPSMSGRFWHRDGQELPW